MNKRLVCPYLTAWIGAWSLLFGTILILISSLFLNPSKDYSIWTTLFGAIAIVFGSLCYTISSFVSQPVLVSVGSVILTLGLALFASSVIWELDDRVRDENIDKVKAYVKNVEDRAIMNVLAMCLVIVAVLCFTKKSVDRLVQPYLGPANYFMLGTLIFGSGAVCYLLDNLTRLSAVDDDEMTISNNTSQLGAILFVAGAFLIMLSVARSINCFDQLTIHNFASVMIWRCPLFAAEVMILAGSLLLIGSSLLVIARICLAVDAKYSLLCAASVILSVGYMCLLAVIMIRSEVDKPSVSLGTSLVIVMLAFSHGVYALGMGLRRHTNGSRDDMEKRDVYSDDLLTASPAVGVTASAYFVLWTFLRASLPAFSPGNMHLMSALINFASHLSLFLHWLQVSDVADDNCSIACDGSELFGYALMFMSQLIFFLFTIIVYDVATIECGANNTNLSLFGTQKAAPPATDIAARTASFRFATMFRSTKFTCTTGLLDEIADINPEQVLVTDVLVVGCGPTGLTLANECGQRGVRVLAVEKRDAIVPDSRFFNLVGPTVDGLKRLGVTDKIFERAVPQEFGYGSTFSTGLAHPDAVLVEAMQGVSRKEAMNQGMNLEDSEGALLMTSWQADEMSQRCMQSVQEQCLKETADEGENIDVRYGWELLQLEDDGEEAYAKIQQIASKQVIYVKAKFIVGCDGPGSVVAKQVQAKFDGFVNLGQTRTVHFSAPELLGKIRPKHGDALQYHVARPGYGIGWFVLNDLAHGLWTFFLIGLGDGRMPRQIDKQEMESVVLREFIGPDVAYTVVSDGSWFWNLFFARNFVYGNIILCGDAAHSWAPFGGLGGNAGYADANNLGWKLAAVIKGWGHRGLLESYNLERSEAGLRTIMTVLNFAPDRNALLRIIELIRYPWLWWTFSYRWIFSNSGAHSGNHFMSEGVQYGMRYRSNVICVDEALQGIPDVENTATLSRPSIVAGGRLPHLRLMNRSLNDTIAKDGYTLLVINPGRVEVVDCMTTALMERAIHRPRSAFPVVQDLCLFFTMRSIPLQVIDLAAELQEVLDIPQRSRGAIIAKMYMQQALILVRPDLYIAWHLPVSSTRVSALHLEKVAQLCCAEVYHQDNIRKTLSTMKWLRSRFIANIQGYRYMHSKATYFENEDKAKILEMISKQSKENVDTLTTKNEVIASRETAIEIPPVIVAELKVTAGDQSNII